MKVKQSGTNIMVIMVVLCAIYHLFKFNAMKNKIYGRNISSWFFKDSQSKLELILVIIFVPWAIHHYVNLR